MQLATSTSLLELSLRVCPLICVVDIFDNLPLVTIKRNKIGTWLNAPDPSLTHRRLLDEHYEGTGRWFLESHELKQWKDLPSSVLWVKGIRKFPISDTLVTAS
jgi:hypothetical protein